MDWKAFGTTFVTLLVAELGDKTQFAVLSIAAKTGKTVSVFLGGALALVVATAAAAVVGGLLAEAVPEVYLSRLAAVAFIGVGLAMLFGWL